jgi:long-chain acyl-CoA synthetase
MQSMDPETLLAQPFATVPELVRLHARVRPTAPALIQDGRSLDYAALDALMDRGAAALQRDGLAPGDTISICASTSIEYAVTYLAALRAGIVVAPLAPSSTPEQLAAMVADCGAKLLFLDRGTDSCLPQRTKRVALDEDFEGWLAPPGATPAPVAADPRAAFNIIYSSGTTGTPKGIVQPNSMRWSQVLRAEPLGYGPDSVTLLSTPLYSNTTLVCFFPSIARGGAVVLMARFDAKTYLTLAEKHRVTHTMLVPVQYQRIMAHPDFAGYDLSSFRMKLCTSAPFAAALKADVLARWPGGLTEYYGMTEGGGTCILAAHDFPDKLHTVGKPATEHDIRLIDDEGKEVAPGGTGEVVGHSPMIMTGYHGQPQKTAEAEWRDASGKRFIRTGDVGRFDSDGFLTLLDRKKDVIISGGFNIYPTDLEAVLGEHPAVAEVAVVGVTSERWGETPVAFVVPRDETPASELLEWVNGKVGKMQRVAAVQLLDALPRSAIGKVLKRELREAWRGSLA